VAVDVREAEDAHTGSISARMSLAKTVTHC
jgi:hypothetical protein